MMLAVAILLVAISALFLVRGAPRIGIAAAFVSTLVFALGWYLLPAPAVDENAAYRPADATLSANDGYVSSKTCRACHPGEYETWAKTYHRKMTQVASPSSVVPDFNQAFEREGRSYRVWREGDRFFADMPVFGTEGKTADQRWQLPVVMTTGSHHMQAYWVPVPAELTAAEVEGRGLFQTHCARCHGDDANGGTAPALVGLGFIPDEMTPWLADGVRGHKKGSGEAAQLTDDEKARLGAYLSRIQFDGRLSQFPFVFLIEQKRWVHEEETFLQPAPEKDAQERPGDRWGAACDECHSVAPRFAYSYADLAAKSEAVELGIACEACHGPGQVHVDQYRDPMARYLEAEPHIVNPARLDHHRSSHVCAQCHADAEEKGKKARDYKPGDDITESVHVVRHPQGGEMPSWLKRELKREPDRLSGTFWEDGTVRVAGRDYNGLVETACYTRGDMSCLSCHRLHGGSDDAYLKPGMDGDAACTQCHAALAVDVEAHTHHPASSSGSRCQGCHMPYTTFGLLQAMRSHRVDSPSASKSAQSGRPDACTLCHLDRSLGWADARLVEWYGTAPASLDERQRSVPASVWLSLEGDGVQRGIMAWHMSYGPALAASGSEWQIPILLALLDDPYAAVRNLAERALRARPGFADVPYDFAAEDEARVDMIRGARQRWQDLGRPGADRAASLVLAVDHGALERELLAMRARRNDAPVRINE